MEINSKDTPADFPANEFTAMIEEVARRNRQGGSLPPERGVAITATPLPTVRSADLGQTTDVQSPPQYSQEEMAELDKLALESGLIRGPVNARIANRLDGGDMDDAQYGSLEEAIAAGAPVGADEESVAAGASRFRDPALLHELPPARAPIGGQIRSRRPIVVPNQLPHLPDFKKVQMIDCVNGKVYVDGMEFGINKGELQMLRKFCVTTAKEQVQKALNEALAALEDEDGGSEAV
jgi:hypothetical protein